MEMAAPVVPPREDPGCASAGFDWEQELDTHRGWLCAVIAAQSVEPDVVEDILQEVAAAAIEQASPIRESERVRGWLYRLAVNQVARHRRRRARQRRHEGKLAELQEQENGHSTEIPLAWLLSQERRELVRQALERLSAEESALLKAKYFENRSYRSLAEELGIGEKAVDARLFRARARLRELLGELRDEVES